MRFKDITGNADILRGLAEMVSGSRIPHAIMFYENDGCGALAIIQSFLQRLYCQNASGGDSCGECPSCSKVSKFIHPDVHYVFPINSGTKVSGALKDLTSEMFLKWWRELAAANPYFMESQLSEAIGIEGKVGTISVTAAKNILEKLTLSSVQGGYSVVVVYLPEKMNQEAANRLLKSIEEPPEKTIFLMITHAPDKVLTTISSRCQGIRVVPLSKEEVASVLEHEFDVDPYEAAQAAAISGGSVGAALKYLSESEDVAAENEIFQNLMNALVTKDLSGALEMGEAMAGLDSREKQKAFCTFAGDCLRKIFMLQQGMPQLAALTPSEEEFYTRIAAACRKSFARNAMPLFDRAMMLIERNVNQKVLFCDLVNHLFFMI